jgi:hypothetical protein
VAPLARVALEQPPVVAAAVAGVAEAAPLLALAAMAAMVRSE